MYVYMYDVCACVHTRVSLCVYCLECRKHTVLTNHILFLTTRISSSSSSRNK